MPHLCFLSKIDLMVWESIHTFKSVSILHTSKEYSPIKMILGATDFLTALIVLDDEPGELGELVVLAGPAAVLLVPLPLTVVWFEVWVETVEFVEGIGLPSLVCSFKTCTRQGNTASTFGCHNHNVTKNIRCLNIPNIAAHTWLNMGANVCTFWCLDPRT